MDATEFVLANITEFGMIDMYTVDQLRDAGVGLVLYPLSAFRAANKAAMNVYQHIRKEGTQKMCSTPCRPVRNCTTASVIMIMKENWTNSIKNIKMAKKEEKQFVPKKSVALSGVAAGNTALASVGRSGNDLHYRGYDILGSG